MLARRILLLILLLSLGIASRGVRLASAGDEWQPISPEELKMTSVPEAPGAPAIYLYRQVDRDDSGNTPHEYNYERIKILTDEGRKHADVEIPFVKSAGNIQGIKARTIRPDGSIANFEGKVYEKTVVKARGLKYLAKTFTLPDVQVGSIIEYHYISDWEPGRIYDSHWILSEELFTKHAKFTLKPYEQFSLRWSWPVGLPVGTAPPKNENHIISLETRNIPAFLTEDYMPPENELKSRVDFIYSDEPSIEKDVAKFWKNQGKKEYEEVERYVGKRKAMEQAVAQIVVPNDSPEVKLRKIYARVQQLRNTTFEKEKTEQEKKRDKDKEVNNVEDVWKRGYGNGRQITWLFLGLARAAGLDASAVLVSRRDEYFFNPKLMNPHELNDNVVAVKLTGKETYFDPGTAFTPYGLLPWPESGVQGLKLDKDGGSWVQTTLPESSVSTVERKAALKLSDDGTLQGKLTVTFSGLEAVLRRTEARNEDETARKKFLEDHVKEYIPVGIEVELTNRPDWSSSAPTLVAEYDLKVQGWASGAGKRALVPVGLFSAPEKHVFEHANRTHDIYFHFPSQRIDDVMIELPLDWQVSSLPAVNNNDAKVCAYTSSVENNRGNLHLSRKLDMQILQLEAKYYTALRNFYQTVKTGDEQQVVLQPGSTATKN